MGKPSQTASTTRDVYSGLQHLGCIAERHGQWKAITAAGRTIGLYATAADASRAVMNRAKATEASL